MQILPKSKPILIFTALLLLSFSIVILNHLFYPLSQNDYKSFRIGESLTQVQDKLKTLGNRKEIVDVTETSPGIFTFGTMLLGKGIHVQLSTSNQQLTEIKLLIPEQTVSSNQTVTVAPTKLLDKVQVFLKVKKPEHTTVTTQEDVTKNYLLEKLKPELIAVYGNPTFDFSNSATTDMPICIWIFQHKTVALIYSQKNSALAIKKLNPTQPISGNNHTPTVFAKDFGN